MSTELDIERPTTTERGNALESSFGRRYSVQRDLIEVAQFVGRKWHPAIVYYLLRDEPLGFSALKEEIDGISNKVLSEALEHLEERQVVDRTIVSERPFRVEYSLTERGRNLEPVIAAMLDWRRENRIDAE